MLEHTIKKAWNRIHMAIGPGLGFVDLRRIAEPAYFASILQATLTLNGLKDDKFPIPKLINKPKDPGTYEELLEKTLKNEEILRKDPLIKLQHTFSEPIKNTRFEEVYNELDDYIKKIVDSHSGGLFLAIPTEPDLTLSNIQMILSVKVLMASLLSQIRTIKARQSKSSRRREEGKVVRKKIRKGYRHG